MDVHTSMPATLQTARCVFTGLDSIERVGQEARSFGKKALIVCDKGITESGIVDRVRNILQERLSEKSKFGNFQELRLNKIGQLQVRKKKL